MSRTNETRHINGTKHVSLYLDQMQLFVIKYIVGIIIFDIEEYLDYENFKCRKDWQINWEMNAMKILMK